MKTSWSKLPEKLQNVIKILVGQAVPESAIKTIFCMFWSITQESLGPQQFLSFSDNLFQDMYIVFKKKVLIILR